MPAKPFPTDVTKQAQSVLDAWAQIGDSVTFGDLNYEAMATEISQADPLQSQMNAVEIQLTNLRNQRDALYQSLWDKVKRVRASVKGLYGDDSTQYEMVGGTRLSERKPTVRKAKVKA